MKKGYLFLIIIALITVFGVIIYITTSNKEIELKNLTTAQQEACKANFDKMFKSIAQVAEVAEQNMNKSQEAFQKLYPELMEGRYSNDRGGALMSWVSENNPNFDLKATSKLYEKLQNTIEANRAEYFMEQKKLISYQKQHKDILMKWPGSWILTGRDTVGITIITSKTTKDVYVSGEENEIDLFKK